MSRAAIQSLLQTGQRLHQAGKLADAEAAYRQVLQRVPDDPTALHLLGLLAHQRGDNDVALDLLRKSVSARRTPPEFHYNFGSVLLTLGDAEGAAAQNARAVESRPGYSQALSNLCIALCRLGRWEEAVAAGERAAGYAPGQPEPRFNLSQALKGFARQLSDHGQIERAVQCLTRSSQLRQDDPAVHVELAATLAALGRFSEAAEACRAAIALKPDDAAAYTTLGAALSAGGHYSAAIAACERAMELDPGDVRSVVNLGTALLGSGRADEAIAAFRRAIDAGHGNPSLRAAVNRAQSNLLMALHYDQRDAAAVLEEHVRAGRAIGSSVRRISHAKPVRGRRIRIGYVSPDFRLHSVAFFIEPVLSAHDRRRFEIFCFSSSSRTDNVTHRLQQYDVHWRDISALSDHQAAELIAGEGIDVLVDLAGHTGESRAALFAMKPAPVQVNYLGYPGTSGLEAMDYRITDAVADPPGMTERFYTEKLVRLRTAWCYRPPETAPPVGRLPLEVAGHVTFGSFNNLQKLTPSMLRLWAQTISAVPDARLLIKAKGLHDHANRDRITDALLAGGLDAGRFELLAHHPSITAHLELYNRVDVALDTFPYNGTTTTCEALWMGVPVVTLAGRVHGARVGASLLSTVGLADLVAEDFTAYARLASELAADAPRLAALRAGLRERVAGSPLVDAVTFTREIESAYASMLGTACDSHALQAAPDGGGEKAEGGI